MGIPTPTASYTAGIIDGEGCISIGRYKRAGRWMQYGLAVIVVSKDPRLTDWLYGRWGGYRGTVTRNRGYSPGIFHRWSISDARAREFLKDILPYLVVKGDQARVAIEFQLLRGHHDSCKGNSNAEQYEQYYQRLRALKRVYAAAETEHPGTGSGETTVRLSAKAE